MDETTILEYMGKLLNSISEERDRYKADAERLAEALENALLYVSGYANNFEEITIARAALAAHERGEG